MKIRKINELTHAESFFQVDTIKGFKYIDKAGEIVNNYHDENNKHPNFEMNLNGLKITNPYNQQNLTLNITPVKIWAGYKVGTLTKDGMVKQFVQETEKIATILEISSYKRIGWRNYFIFELNQAEDTDKVLPVAKKEKDLNVQKINTLSLKLSFKEDTYDIVGNLIIEPVVRDDGSKNGILFDIDLFSEGSFESADISKVLNSIKGYLDDKQKFVLLLNTFLKKDKDSENDTTE